MQIAKENPAFGARGVPNSDLAGASIGSDFTHVGHLLQARRLVARFAFPTSTAAAIAELVFLVEATR
jgi:hypothetical protein